jgi:excisionase family DNA binding protein
MTASVPELTTMQAAKELGVTPRALYSLIDAGRLPFVRRGRQLYIKLRDVDALRATAAAEAEAARDREKEKTRALRLAGHAAEQVRTSLRARDSVITWAAQEHGASLREIADATGLPPMTVKRIIDRSS